MYTVGLRLKLNFSIAPTVQSTFSKLSVLYVSLPCSLCCCIACTSHILSDRKMSRRPSQHRHRHGSLCLECIVVLYSTVASPSVVVHLHSVLAYGGCGGKRHLAGLSFE